MRGAKTRLHRLRNRDANPVPQQWEDQGMGLSLSCQFLLLRRSPKQASAIGAKNRPCQAKRNGTQSGTQKVFLAMKRKGQLESWPNVLIYMVGPHGLEPWTKGL